MKEIKEILSPIFTAEWVRCKKCGHSADSHYWNGGGRVENSGYDSCHVEGCKCVYDEKETEILYTVAEEALKNYADEIESHIDSHYIAKEKVRGLKMDKKTGEIVGVYSDKDYGYNIAVSEINKAVDDLVGDLK